ncbi:hypothetical protein O0L34_g9423 [Tuta absoluta]|nr:hypothetical protein O0L34_g9423 [Tuta absoluta]
MGFPHSTWNFSESAHGKGAADGVGGGLKRRLDDFVKHGTDIPDAHTAYTLLQNSDTTVMTFYIQEADIAKYSIEGILTPVPQTMNKHQITLTDTINVIRFSTDEDDQYSLHDSSEDNFYEESISDTDKGMEDMIQYFTKNKIHKKSNDNETENKAENFEEIHCTPRAGMEESTQINRYKETENKAENFKQNDCSPKAGMEESKQINIHNETENKAENLKQDDCSPKAGMEECTLGWVD